jgi:DNA-binding transcriptional LysR family regulator
MKALDVEAVQAFVLVADLKSFTRAAEALGSTQSAVSVKIRRLESSLGRRLLERTPRLVRLSAQGLLFLGAARSFVAAHQGALNSFDVQQRRLTVGISHHIVGTELPVLLKRMSIEEPEVVVELRVSSSRAILDDFDRGTLDAAITLRHDRHRSDGDVIVTDAFGWMATPAFEHDPSTPLRLATQAEPCSVRSMALDALTEAGVMWTEVFVGGGVATVGAAVSAGLAVAALSRRVAPPGTIDVSATLGLPPLPERDVVLHSNLADQQTRRSLRTLSDAIRSTAG